MTEIKYDFNLPQLHPNIQEVVDRYTPLIEEVRLNNSENMEKVGIFFLQETLFRIEAAKLPEIRGELFDEIVSKMITVQSLVLGKKIAKDFELDNIEQILIGELNTYRTTTERPYVYSIGMSSEIVKRIRDAKPVEIGTAFKIINKLYEKSLQELIPIDEQKKISINIGKKYGKSSDELIEFSEKMDDDPFLFMKPEYSETYHKILEECGEIAQNLAIKRLKKKKKKKQLNI